MYDISGWFREAFFWFIALLPLMIAQYRNHRNALAITALNVLTVCPFLAMRLGSLAGIISPANPIVYLLFPFPALLLAFIGWLIGLVWSLTANTRGLDSQRRAVRTGVSPPIKPKPAADNKVDARLIVPIVIILVCGVAIALFG